MNIDWLFLLLLERLVFSGASVSRWRLFFFRDVGSSPANAPTATLTSTVFVRRRNGRRRYITSQPNITLDPSFNTILPTSSDKFTKYHASLKGFPQVVNMESSQDKEWVSFEISRINGKDSSLISIPTADQNLLSSLLI